MIQEDLGAFGIAGDSSVIRDLRQTIRDAATSPYPVLVEGESGSGKELVASAVHRLSPRAARPLCPLNCAAVTDELFEAELFGFARGAFTGAVRERRGLFEEADSGAVFLDEVAELSARAQAKLLRTLQEGEIRRLGENRPRRVDVRVIAATNRPLAAEVDAGRFRRDLWYRLDVVRIAVPALRDQPGDVRLLARRFWGEAARAVGNSAVLDSEAIDVLTGYSWPGNVRELQNVMTALAVTGPRRGRVRACNLPRVIADGRGRVALTLHEARRTFERRHVREALAQVGGHRGKAARALGVSRQGLAKLIKRLEVA